MFIHSLSSLKNHTQFQTEMGKVYTRFQTKKAEKPFGTARTCMGFVRENPPPPQISTIVVLYYIFYN